MQFNDGFGKEANVVLRVKIPSGFYCMHGKDFQRIYTHEIKETHDKEFTKLCQQLEKNPNFPDLPSKDEYGRKKIPQAEYVMKHAEKVRKVIDSCENRQMSILDMFGDKSQVKGPKPPKRQRIEKGSWFDEWIQPRISYTLRRFDSL